MTENAVQHSTPLTAHTAHADPSYTALQVGNDSMPAMLTAVERYQLSAAVPSVANGGTYCACCRVSAGGGKPSVQHCWQGPAAGTLGPGTGDPQSGKDRKNKNTLHGCV